MESQKQNPHLFTFLCWLQILFFSSYSVPLPIFPEIAMSKGITNDAIGFALATYPLSYFLVSILCGKNMEKWGGKKKIFDVAFTLMIASTLMFLLLFFINNHFFFLFVAIIIRLLQGMSIGGFAVVCYSLIPEYWPETMEKKLGLMEFFSGLGMGIGPLFSGLLYYSVGYVTTFILISITYLLNFIVVKTLIGFENKTHNDSIKRTEQTNIDSLDIFLFIKDPKLMVAIAIFCATMMSCIFLYPILGTHINDIGGNVVDLSIAFAIYTFSYSFGSIGVGYYSTFPKGSCLLLGAIICLISFFLINFAYNVTLLTICMGFIGIGQAFVLIPQIPLMIEICLNIKSDRPELVHNMVSGFFNAGISGAEFFGPICGGCFMVWFGFHNAINFYSLIFAIIIIVYFIYSGGREIFKKKIENKEALLHDIELIEK